MLQIEIGDFSFQMGWFPGEEWTPVYSCEIFRIESGSFTIFNYRLFKFVIYAGVGE